MRAGHASSRIRYCKENIPASGIRASLSLTDPVIVPGMSDISPRILCSFCNAITV